MTRQNRVTPTGDFISDPARGTLMGNRGILHDAEGNLGPARWKHRAWVCCLLSFKQRRRPIMAPNRYTELFFLDECVALAAGHRPCGECRRHDAQRFRAAWTQAHGTVENTGENTAKASLEKTPTIDRLLHAARVNRYKSQITHTAPAASLPNGTFINAPINASINGPVPSLIWGPQIFPYSPKGYLAPIPRPTGTVTVLTPAPIVATLTHGYLPTRHASAMT